MVLWSLVAAGNAADDAADDLRRDLGALLGDPRYGCGINMLHVDPALADALDGARDAACA